ncbi:hypothetical protein [Dactylosporangium sp. NPDC049140]|uniref:hypothetical protein n=1 Tax=Dactylosporangium sp. NPDC049140 TaxID=3155647 RepID=UPI0034119DD7
MDAAVPARRRWTVRTAPAVIGAAVLLAAVAVGVPLALHRAAGEPAVPAGLALDADHCPVAWPTGGAGTADRPGPLVPADGVVAVTLCELPAGPPGPGGATGPRVLTARAGEVVAAMNALPAVPAGEHGCTLVGFAQELSLVVSYAARAPVAVLLDRNCATATAGGRTRRSAGSEVAHPVLVDGFLERYREQLAAATDPAGVAAPGCAATLAQAEVDVRTMTAEPRDEIARNRGGVEAFAPSGLVEARVCRYRTGPGGLELAAQHAGRQDLAGLRDLLNEAGTVRTVAEPAGAQSVANLSPCPPGERTAVDVVWVADVTGAVGEAVVPRAPCAEFRRAAIGPLAAPAPLLAELDRRLA